MRIGTLLGYQYHTQRNNKVEQLNCGVESDAKDSKYSSTSNLNGECFGIAYCFGLCELSGGS